MRARNIGRGAVAACAAGVIVVGLAAVPAQAAGLAMTLSSVSGPSGGANTITGTVAASTANPSPLVAGTQPVVQFQYNGTGSTQCTVAPRPVTQIAGTGQNTTAGAQTVDPDDVQRITGTRLSFTVPAAPYPPYTDGGDPSTINITGLALVGTQTSSKWFVCVYDSSNALIASAVYLLAARPKIISILPASSPAFGGQTVTINGVGFNPASGSTTVAVGGVSLKDVRVATSGTSLTGTTLAHAPGDDMSVVVTTTGGPVSSADPDNNGLPQDTDSTTPDAPILFTYANGISINPPSAQAGTKANIDIKGTSFDSLTFSKTAAPTDPTAHVFLVRDAYSAASNRGVQECKNVKLVSSAELVCSLDLSADRLNPADSSVVTGTPVSEGTYTITVVANGSPSVTDDVASASIVSTGATFTVAPF